MQSINWAHMMAIASSMPSEYSVVLAYLCSNPGTTMNALSADLEISVGEIDGIIADLVERGLVRIQGNGVIIPIGL